MYTRKFKDKITEAELREVEITFSDGSILTTNMASHLTDEEIKDYYKVGSSFNIGAVKDKMVKVKSVKILK